MFLISSHRLLARFNATLYSSLIWCTLTYTSILHIKQLITPYNWYISIPYLWDFPFMQTWKKICPWNAQTVSWIAQFSSKCTYSEILQSRNLKYVSFCTKDHSLNDLWQYRFHYCLDVKLKGLPEINLKISQLMMHSLCVKLVPSSSSNTAMVSSTNICEQLIYNIFLFPSTKHIQILVSKDLAVSLIYLLLSTSVGFWLNFSKYPTVKNILKKPVK
jgi:hypothetical protein